MEIEHDLYLEGYLYYYDLNNQKMNPKTMRIRSESDADPSRKRCGSVQNRNDADPSWNDADPSRTEMMQICPEMMRIRPKMMRIRPEMMRIRPKMMRVSPKEEEEHRQDHVHTLL